MKNRIFPALLMIAFLLSLTGLAYAQGTNLGTIRGRVADPTGAALPNVPVKITDMQTGIDRDLTTNEDGIYEAAGLKSGNYKVTVTVQGFKTQVIDVALTGSNTVRADADLQIGESTATVDITAEAGLIQTENQTISNTITNRQIIDLPRDSRDVYDFLYLNPNITQSADGAGFKFIGAQSYGAAFSLDGQRANGGIFGGPTNSQPSLEAIGEVTVLSNSFTAEYAGIANIRVQTKRGTKDFHGSLFYNNKNSALAAWKVLDKVNRFNFVPSFARPDYPKPYFNLNEFGGSINGPVPFLGKDKTFFLFSYERRWNINPVLFAARNSVPGQRVLNGDFTQLPNANKPAVPAAVLPLLTPEELAANTVLVGTTRRFVTIPNRLMNPSVRLFVQNYFPTSSLDAPVQLTTGRLVDFAQNLTARNTRDLYTARIDHDFSPNDKFYAVYNYQNNPQQAAQFAGAGYPAFGLRVDDRSNQTLSFSYTRIFSPSLINEARGGFNTQNEYRRASQTLREFLQNIGFSASDITAYGAVVGPEALDTYGVPGLQLGPYAAITGNNRNANRTLDQKLITFGDTLTWIKGRHTIKGGFDVVRNRGTDGFVANRNFPRGRIQYTGSNADALARFLTGAPANQVQFVGALRGQLDASNYEYGYFGQDEFKVSPNLTLTLGLRYEINTPFVDKENLLVNFDPNYVSPTGRKGRFIIPTSDVLPRIDPAIVNYGVVTAAEVGVGPGLLKTDKNNFAPRLGIAYRLNDKTVIRGGFGLFYPTSAAQGIRDAFGSTPFNQSRTKLNNNTTPLGGFPGFPAGPLNGGPIPLSGGTTPVIGNRPAVNAIPFDLQQPRIEQFNATFEREVGWNTGVRISYLGSRMNGLIGGIDLNMLPPSTTPFGTTTGDGITPCNPDSGNCQESPADIARRPFPELGAFLASYGNFANGRSHALQIEVNRRFASGFTFNASYTLLDQKGSGFDVGASSLGGTSYNQFNPQNDFATDAFVSRHRFVSYGVLELPFGRSRKYGTEISRWADYVAGGWNLSWNMFAKSGTGFTPFFTCGNCGVVFPGNIGSDFLDATGAFIGSSYRPNIIDGQSPYNGPNGAFFNSAAFGVPSVGADFLDNPAVARRNFLTGPGTWGVNLGIRKNFRFTETVKLEIGADLDNVFNHPLLSPTNIDFANIGTFFLDVDPVTGSLLPITRIERNPDFGFIRQSYRQEGIDDRRTIRLRARLTF
jgi:hypothetical protein